MLQYQNIIGNQEDWANLLTNIQMIDTPFLDWLPQGQTVQATIRSYQAEKYDDPAENVHIDGKPITGFKSAADGRGRLKALIQYFTKTSSVSRLAQDLSTNPAIEDELAHDMVKRTKELSVDIEAAFLDNNDCQEDNGAKGFKTRTVDAWIATSAQATYPVPSAFRPASASISTTASTSLTENVVLDILESIGRVTKSKDPVTAFCGPKMKRAFNNIPFFTVGSTLVGGSPTGASGVVYNRNGKVVDRTFQRYESDFGPVDVTLSWRNNALTGTSTEQNYATYFLHQSKWELCYGPGVNKGAASGKPTWFRKEYQGGAYEAFCECILMLACLNPAGEGKYRPTA